MPSPIAWWAGGRSDAIRDRRASATSAGAEGGGIEHVHEARGDGLRPWVRSTHPEA